METITPRKHETSLKLLSWEISCWEQLFSLCVRTPSSLFFWNPKTQNTHIYRTAGQRRSAADLRWAKSTKISSRSSIDQWRCVTHLHWLGQRRCGAHLCLTWSTKMWPTSSLTKSNEDVPHIFVDQVKWRCAPHLPPTSSLVKRRSATDLRWLSSTKICYWSLLTWFNEDLLLIFVDQQSYIYVFCVLGFQTMLCVHTERRAALSSWSPTIEA